jgi:endonuclease III
MTIFLPCRYTRLSAGFVIFAMPKQNRKSHINRISIIIRRLKGLYPSTAGSLRHNTPFELLVATILSAQSTDITANRLTRKLFEKYGDVRGFSRARLSELEHDAYSSGFYKMKSRNIINAAKKIVSDFKGKVPSSMDLLLTLPGVGRKTANIVLSTAFKKREGIAVDTHVKRISQRLGFTSNTIADKIEQDLLKIIPYRYWLDFNLLLVNFGRAVCKSKKPLCDKCILRDICTWGL